MQELLDGKATLGATDLSASFRYMDVNGWTSSTDASLLTDAAAALAQAQALAQPGLHTDPAAEQPSLCDLERQPAAEQHQPPGPVMPETLPSGLGQLPVAPTGELLRQVLAALPCGQSVAGPRADDEVSVSSDKAATGCFPCLLPKSPAKQLLPAPDTATDPTQRLPRLCLPPTEISAQAQPGAVDGPASQVTAAAQLLTGSSSRASSPQSSRQQYRDDFSFCAHPDTSTRSSVDARIWATSDQQVPQVSRLTWSYQITKCTVHHQYVSLSAGNG